MVMQRDVKMYAEQTWISKCGGRSSHDSGDQGIGLTEGGIGNMQPLYSNAVEGCVVQHHNSICIQGEALQSEQGVIGLHHHIAGLILVGKHTAGKVMSSQRGARTVYHYKAFAGHMAEKKKKITSFGQPTSLIAHGRASATLPSVIHICYAVQGLALRPQC